MKHLTEQDRLSDKCEPIEIKLKYILHWFFFQTMDLQTSVATFLEKMKDASNFTTGYMF